jgi:hypothetical protein
MFNFKFYYMAEESKTYVFGNGESSSLAALAPALSNAGMSPALMASMMNSGFGGGQGAWWIIIFIIALMGRGWGGNQGDTDAILAALNNDTGRDMLLSAITGNSNAIS